VANFGKPQANAHEFKTVSIKKKAVESKKRSFAEMTDKENCGGDGNSVSEK